MPRNTKSSLNPKGIIISNISKGKYWYLNYLGNYLFGISGGIYIGNN